MTPAEQAASLRPGAALPAGQSAQLSRLRAASPSGRARSPRRRVRRSFASRVPKTCRPRSIGVLARRQRHVAVLAGDGTVRERDRTARPPSVRPLASRPADPARRSKQPHRRRPGGARRCPRHPGEGAGAGERRPLGRRGRRAGAALHRPGAGAAALRLLLRRRRGRQRRPPRPGPSLRRQRPLAHRPPELAVGARQARRARPGRPGEHPLADARDRGRGLRQPARRDPPAAGDDAAAPHRPVRSLRRARPRRRCG